MQKTCTISGQTFELTEKDLAFFKTMGVGGPTMCPEEMARLRLSFRNEIDLLYGRCSKTGRRFITNQPPHVPYPVYARDVWWSDQWDPMAYGQAIDQNQSFFTQFAKLSAAVPRPNICVVDSENCEYTNFANHNKNCYLVFGSWFDEDCLYGQSIYHSNSCLDCHYVGNSQYCYGCVDSKECYESLFCQNCQGCRESLFLYDCRQCEHCIGCWNLRGKGYHVWNKEVGKDRYQETLRSLRGSWQKTQEFHLAFQARVRDDAIHKSFVGEKNERVTGDFIYNSRNIVASFNVQESEDIFYSDRTLHQKNQYYCTGVHEGERAYFCLNVDFSHNIICCMNGEHLADCAYCSECYSCNHCFGCIGLRRKEYCILNKQYAKEEYETLAQKIITRMQLTGEWGEYFPIAMNPFYFNRSVAQDYFHLTKEEAVERGFKWKDDVDKVPQVQKKIPANRLPDSIDAVPDDVLDWAIICEATRRPFLIVQQELAFYRKFHIPIPHFHPEERSRRRLALRNPRTLWKRSCMKCGKEMETTYSPERPEKVYCEECYLADVY